MKFKMLIYISILIGLAYIFHSFEICYSYTDFKDYLSALLTASSMVFTIMGIWIAFLYPNALQKLVNPVRIENADFSETLSETKRLEGLVYSVLESAFVVSMIIVIFMMKTVLSKLSIYSANIELIKSIALSLVIFLSIIQFKSIFYVIYSNVMFITELHRRREDREADADI